MERREKIILAVMAVAVIIGGYDFLFKSSKSGPVIKKKGEQELTVFVTSVVGGIQNKDVQSDYLLELAALNWEKDPFLSFNPATRSEAGSKMGRGSRQGEGLSYSGYLKMGGKALAVIDGIEYEKGENLANGEYLVEEISPESVVLRSSSSSNVITLFLDEAY